MHSHIFANFFFNTSMKVKIYGSLGVPYLANLLPIFARFSSLSLLSQRQCRSESWKEEEEEKGFKPQGSFLKRDTAEESSYLRFWCKWIGDAL